MNKSITPDITITIEGAPGTGKTTLLNLIGKNLLNQGMNIQCIERFKNGAAEESYHTHPIAMPFKQRDDRLIHVIALDKTSSQKPTRDSYPEITETIRNEIQRLIKKSREIRPGENGEIYREWAYGVFLAWKLIAADNATAGDETLLEALATGEQPF